MDLPHLRSFRQRAVMSQEQLAEKSGVVRDTISKLETGQRKTYPSTIRKLAAGLEVEPRLLLTNITLFTQVLETCRKSDSSNAPSVNMATIQRMAGIQRTRWAERTLFGGRAVGLHRRPILDSSDSL